MELKEIYHPRHDRRHEQEQIPTEVLADHISAVRQAYEQAGLDPADFRSDVCLGLHEEDGDFQVRLMQTPTGEVLGVDALATDSTQEHINETTIFMWGGEFETTSGRLSTPVDRYIVDYKLTSQNIRTMTDFLTENVAVGKFVAVPRHTILPLPQ